MIEKYIVKLSEEAPPFGIWYKPNRKVLMIAGPIGSKKCIETFISTWMNKEILEEVSWQGRVRYKRSQVGLLYWSKIKKVLQYHYYTEKVRNFRRLIW